MIGSVCRLFFFFNAVKGVTHIMSGIITDAELIVASARRIIESFAEDTELIDTESPPEDDTPEDDTDFEEASSLKKSFLVVGKGEGTPGSEVTIEVLVSTHVPINGFGLAITLTSELRYVSSTPSNTLLQMLNRKKLWHIVKRNDGASWKEQYLQVGVIFMGQVLTQADVEAPITDEVVEEIEQRIKGLDKTITDLQIPQLIPVYEMVVQIPADAKPGKKYELSASWKLGRPLKNSDGRVRWLYYPTELTVSRHVQRWAVRPEFVSGWIDVI